MFTLEKDAQRLLLSLADIDARGGEVPVAEATRDAAAEDRELQKLQDELRNRRRAANATKLSITEVEADIRRLQVDTNKLQHRQRDARKGLGAATDVEMRRDLQHDLASATRRVDDLRGEIKEAHDELHALRANHERQGADIDAMQERVDAALRARDAAHEAQDARVSEAASRREELRAQLAAKASEALEAYDEQREISGVGAARLTGRVCGGCHLVLPPAFLTKVRNAPETAVFPCPECGALLLRAA